MCVTMVLQFVSVASSSLLSKSASYVVSFPTLLKARHSGCRSFAAASSGALAVCVKASVITSSKIGDCPFSQKVLLTLEEKHLPYELKLIDLDNKPEWFLKASPHGKVPVIKIEEKWVWDSDVIVRALEEKYPSPRLAVPSEKATIGSKMLSSFVRYLQSKGTNERAEQTLLKELDSLNDHIKENGPFINGDSISAADLSLGPMLYHMEVALNNYKKWTVPESVPHVKSYMKMIFSRDSFIKTMPQPEDVIEGWRKKLDDHV